jgi:uncharacterized membrane protein YjjP (DUF1212 family)
VEATQAKHLFLIRVAELLHRHGTPSHRLERVMEKVAKTLDVESVFLYTPTALVVSLGSGADEKTYMRRIDSGSIDADKLNRFDEILERLEDGQIGITAAAEQLEVVAAAKPIYPAWLVALACGLACTSVAIFFGGSLVESGLAGAIGLFLALLEIYLSRLKSEVGLLFPLSGFAAAIIALSFARLVMPIDDRIVTLASVIILLPGLTLTIAMTEITVGHLSSGVARLAGASVTLFTLFLGVAIAWRFCGHWRVLPDQLTALPGLVQTLATIIAPAAFAILFKVPLRMWPLVFGISLGGFVVAKWGGHAYGVEVGSFLGALVVGCGSNLYARLADRPAMVLVAPGLLILVPGSLGYRSLSAMLNRQTVEGVEFAFGTVLVAMALVGGLLTASALFPPKRIL